MSILLREIHEVEYARLEMRERGDALHLDVVHLFEGMVENTWSVDDLPPHVTVVQVTDEQGLGREGVGLDVDVCAGDFVGEGGLPDIGVVADESTSGGVGRGETGYTLADFLEERGRHA